MVLLAYFDRSRFDHSRFKMKNIMIIHFT